MESSLEISIYPMSSAVQAWFLLELPWLWVIPLRTGIWHEGQVNVWQRSDLLCGGIWVHSLDLGRNPSTWTLMFSLMDFEHLFREEAWILWLPCSLLLQLLKWAPVPVNACSMFHGYSELSLYSYGKNAFAEETLILHVGYEVTKSRIEPWHLCLQFSTSPLLWITLLFISA